MPTALNARAVPAPPGPEWCRAWTGDVDAALQAWLGELPSEAARQGGVAVVALGSYARRELCPASDVDLLLLHDGWRHQHLETLVRQLCYPLWDAGLVVGHAVQTPKQAVAAASQHPESATALADLRLVTGSRGLLDELAGRHTRWLGAHAGKVLDELAKLDARRRARAGASAGMLEPDLKDGAGGLRDVHSLRWAASCVLGRAGLDPLVGARYLGAHEHRAVFDAHRFLLAVRCALHLVESGRGANRLRLELQDEVAERVGLGDADELMRQVGLAMRAVAHVHGRAWPRLLADARGGRRRRKPAPEKLDDGIEFVDGLVEIADGWSLERDPSLPLRAVAAAAGRGARLGRGATERLRPEGRLPWDARTRAALLTTLRHGEEALPALADADQMGVLEAYLPGWSHIRGRRQRNPYHLYDLDTHHLQAIAELGRVRRGALDARHAVVWEGIHDPDVVLLATFLHDIGKAVGAEDVTAAPDGAAPEDVTASALDPAHGHAHGPGGDHCITGAVAARDWMLAMGFSHRRAERVAELVRLHLLLPDVATGHDLDDPEEIRAVARQTQRAETLDGLYLLSLADGRATGPSAWSAWKETLLAELHARVRREFDGADRERRRLAAPDTVVDEAGRLLDGTGIDLAPIVAGLPRRYLLVASAGQLAAHARLLATPLAGHELRASFHDGSAGTEVLSIAAQDRRGLVADCAGVLAGHGLTVLEARAFTHDDGTALDWFVVGGAEDTQGLGIGRDAVVADLVRVAAGTGDVSDLVRRRDARRRRFRRLGDTDVAVTFERGPVVTRMQVEAPDTPGLLYRLARVLADAGLDVVGARVATLGPHVRDVFFVRSDGAALDPGSLTPLLQEAAAGPR